MKGVICYYSATGNTRLACHYIAKRIRGLNFELVDITKTPEFDCTSYDIVGFACPTDFWGPPHLMELYIAGLPKQKEKPAFIFNTYGLISGRTLATLSNWISKKGFRVFAGHALHTPENYPPMIVAGLGSDNAPYPRDMRRLDKFIDDLENLLDALSAGLSPVPSLRIGFLNAIFPSRKRTTAREDMREKFVDQGLCDECGVCEKVCPYQAISLDPKPVFDMAKCYGCWSCFNRCPTQAIYTRKFRGRGHYPKPPRAMAERLSQ